ncbi:uncharacterized protein LOC118490346 [Helianthus annuus]|uniref:uncharacterized protein LOC118490346 n=1 Tax=Helianthus annuus TaxID=4232 RepID=UPI00165314B6|nr:uncharacterized protein LOC118490346 [Helianthus annuus]
MLTTALCQYLRETKHPAAEDILSCEPNRLELKWRTRNNSNDCGIFAMRHMEYFKGETTKNWNCGLRKESPDQVYDLNDLRLKYLAKILLSDLNTNKEFVLDEVRQFKALDLASRKEHMKDAYKRINRRVTEF